MRPKQQDAISWTICFKLGAYINVLLFLSIQAFAGQDSQFRIHVLNYQHENVDKALVELTSRQNSQTATTSVDGMATFANLAPGKYNVSVSASGFVRWQLLDHEITSAQEHPILATLKPGTLGCDLRYEIEYDNSEPGPAVRGVVIDSGKGIRGAKLLVRLSGEKIPRVTLRSQKKGLFQLPDLSPGRYRLRVTNESYQDLEIDLAVPTQDISIVTIKPMRKGYVEICE